MTYLHVRNWRKYQHYSKRNPPWIKLHYEMLSSHDWVMLADTDRVLAVASMLIASRNNGVFQNDQEYIKRVAYLNSTPDFSNLLRVGFLELTDELGNKIDSDASACKQMLADACSETEEETYTEKETEKEYNTTPKPQAKKATKRAPSPITQLCDWQIAPFEEFWDAYPNAVKKSETRSSFAKEVVDMQVALKITESLKWQIPEWRTDAFKFCPMSTTYLNGHRWEDKPKRNGQEKSAGVFVDPTDEAMPF